MRTRNIIGAGEAISASPYCINDPYALKGKWHAFLGNGRPIHIEVGMGKGLFLTQLAPLHPEIEYVGIESNASVLFRALQRLQQMQPAPPDNLRFICMDAEYLPEVFDAGEVDRIYLNFSDPWPKDRHAKRRLTGRRFLDCYDRILSPDGRLDFKTDNRGLFDFSLGEIAADPRWSLVASTLDLHHDPALNEGNIMTEYEKKFSAMGKPIFKLILQRAQADT